MEVVGKRSLDIRTKVRKNRTIESTGLSILHQKSRMDYTKLEAWQLARQLTNEIYDLLIAFPKEESFGLCDQMRRAAVSVPANIAEGCGRQSMRDALRFWYIARGSLFELETHCYLSFDRQYIDESHFQHVFGTIQSCKRLLNGLIRFYAVRIS